MKKNISGWGRYPLVSANIYSFYNQQELAYFVKKSNGIIARGMGRSYGDSSLSKNVILSIGYNKFCEFNASTGLITCDAGVTFAELITHFLPRGWFPQVIPGTKFVTIGGAIASDIHGKNHHKSGCFSECVESFNLLLPSGNMVHCDKKKHFDLFRATCGGMGLTGIILNATIRMKRVKSGMMLESIEGCNNLESVFKAFEIHRKEPYSVAWIDCLASGSSLGRSILIFGRHAESGSLSYKKPSSFSLPFVIPGFILNQKTVSFFNRIYYAEHSRKLRRHLVPIDPFFFPLDRINNWNRLYGYKGFSQYQCVLPKKASFDGLSKILTIINRSGLGSFLAVLKLFGPANSNYLSFPMEGYTLALDFKIEFKLFKLLNQLDDIVLDCGGRLYLAKDVRMTKHMFIKTYPKAMKFKSLRKEYGMENKFNSLQSKRLGI